MGREREEWDGIRRDWEGAKPLIYKGFGGFGYPFNALRRRVHYPLCYGERPTPGDANGRPSEPRFYAICRAKTSEAPEQRAARAPGTDDI